MQTNYTKLIDQYLLNELNDIEKIAFEKEVANNPSLQKELQLQKELIEGIQRSALRSQIQKIGKKYHFNKILNTSVIVFSISLVTALLTYFIYQKSKDSNKETKIENISSEMLLQFEQNAPIDHLSSSYFYWKNNDSVLLSKAGVLLSVPKNAFLVDGKPYAGDAIIQWQEALDGPSIVKSGLSTMSNDQLLETQGMFGFQAYTKEGKKLTVNPKVGVYVQSPVNEHKSGMQLFSGEKDKNGMINWVNPKPLQKIPTPVDMSQLDFYPNGYEAKLNELKKPLDKKYRDSLYLSFEEEMLQSDGIHLVDSIQYPHVGLFQDDVLNNGIKKNSVEDKIKWDFELEHISGEFYNIVGNATIKNNWHVFSVNHKPENADLTGLPTKLNIKSSKNFKIIGKTFDGLKAKKVINELGTSYYFENKAVFKQKIKLETKNKFNINLTCTFQICDENGCIYKVEKITIPVAGNGKEETTVNTNIPPSKVLAFWNKKFNQTILATKEFETRMKSIHKTCNPKLLELYTANLSKSMVELDQKAAKMGYPEFEEFAKEQVGPLNANNPHLKGLMQFYQSSIQKLKSEVKKNKKLKDLNDSKWNNEMNASRNQEMKRMSNQRNIAYEEEFNLNLSKIKETKIIRQFGKTVGFRIRGNATVFNIDKYVREATVNRKSTTIVDPATGKTAEIIYNAFSFKVKNAGDYPQLFAYLFPSKINAYQRISASNDEFNYPLNNDMQYDLCIVGISEQGHFYHERKNLNKGDLGEISLEAITDEALNENINALNEARGVSKKMSIIDEIKWLLKEQKNYVVLKKRKENEAFRASIRQIIFPCMEANGTSEKKIIQRLGYEI